MSLPKTEHYIPRTYLINILLFYRIDIRVLKVGRSLP